MFTNLQIIFSALLDNTLNGLGNAAAFIQANDWIGGLVLLMLFVTLLNVKKCRNFMRDTANEIFVERVDHCDR